MGDFVGWGRGVNRDRIGARSCSCNESIPESILGTLRRIEHGVGVGSSMGNDCFLILEIMTVLVLFQSCSRTVVPDFCFI